MAAIATVALAPLHAAHRIRRLSVVTYQAASARGAAAMEETASGHCRRPCRTGFRTQVLPHPYAFNLFSHNAEVDPITGYNGEETKVVAETRRIMGLPDLRWVSPASACRSCARMAWRFPWG